MPSYADRLKFSDDRLKAIAQDQARDDPQAVTVDDDGEAKWPYALLVGGQVADIASTVAALKNPKLREANPMGAAGAFTYKAALTGALAWLMHHEAERGNTKAQKAIGTIGGLLGAVPAAWNVSQMHKHGK